MVATAKTQQKRAFRRIDAKTYHVESLSETLGYHVVRQDGRKGWHCDKFCRSYGYRYQCGHIDVVIRHERWLAEAQARLTASFDRMLAQHEQARQSRSLPDGDEYSTLEAGDGPVYDGNSCCLCWKAGYPPFHLRVCSCPCHSVVPVPPPVKKLTLEDVFSDYA